MTVSPNAMPTPVTPPKPDETQLPRRKNAPVVIETLDAAAPLKGKRVLDIGCGDGGLVRRLTEAGAKAVVGLECGAGQIKRIEAAERAGDEAFTGGFGEALPFSDEAFDVVIFFNSLHHVPVAGQSAALKEAHRVLKPGGFLYVAEPVASGSNFELGQLIDDETEIRAAAYGALKAVTGPLFGELGEFHYILEMRHTDYASYKERSIRINPHRKAAFDAHGEEIERRFESMGTPQDDGTRLYLQPIRINLLSKLRT